VSSPGHTFDSAKYKIRVFSASDVISILKQTSLYAVGYVKAQDIFAWDMGVRFQDSRQKEAGIHVICALIPHTFSGKPCISYPIFDVRSGIPRGGRTA
jgi:hypothetical protein